MNTATSMHTDAEVMYNTCSTKNEYTSCNHPLTSVLVRCVHDSLPSSCFKLKRTDHQEEISRQARMQKGGLVWTGVSDLSLSLTTGVFPVHFIDDLVLLSRGVSILFSLCPLFNIFVVVD